MKKKLALMAMMAALTSTQSRAEVDMMRVAARICDMAAGTAKLMAEFRDEGRSRQSVKKAVKGREDEPTILVLIDLAYDSKDKDPSEVYTSVMGNCMADSIKKMEHK